MVCTGAPDLSAGMPTSTSTTQSSATPTPSASSTPSSTSSSNAGAIAGGVVGGIVGFVAAILLACIFYRRRIRSQRDGQRIEFRRERIDLGESTLPTQMATVLLPTQRPKLYVCSHSSRICSDDLQLSWLTLLFLVESIRSVHFPANSTPFTSLLYRHISYRLGHYKPHWHP